jgi:hypothetical protein
MPVFNDFREVWIIGFLFFVKINNWEMLIFVLFFLKWFDLVIFPL